MKKNYFALLFILILFGLGNTASAQLTGGEIFLPGHWLEIGVNSYGAFGSLNVPAAPYHPYPGGTELAETFDYGHDGWTSGAPALMGDYTFPGTPYEGWGIQVGSAAGLNWMFTENLVYGTGISGTGSLTGANTTYVNAGGRLLGNWAGTTAGGQLKINMETRVDTNASWVVVTAKLYNTGATALNNIYYFRGCDPDNDEAHGGSFATKNTITYQNDVDHRVGVSGKGETYTYAYLQLCTKDCRAKSFIDEEWPVDDYVTNMSTLYAGTSGIGTTYAVGGTDNGDYGIGLVYNIGTIAAGDSTFVSYAYTFLNAATAIDSAFPEPTLVVNGVPVIPPAAPNPTYDTINTCGSSLTTIPVNLSSATTGDWTWSKWTWATSTGLATTTGVVNTITVAALPPTITYTITGTNAVTCATRVMYLTIIACNNAVVNTPCLGDSLIFNAPGDSTGATYVWYGPAPSTTVIGTTQSSFIYPSTWADTGTYHVVKTVAGGHDTTAVHATIHPVPVISGPTQVCAGSTITLLSSLTGTVWSSTNTGVATVGSATGIVTGVAPGVVVIDDSLNTCKSTYTVTVNPVSPITGTAVLCMGSTTSLSDVVGSGTWNSSNPGVATISATGLVNGVSGGTSTISYTTPAGCLSTRIVTVDPLSPINGTTLVCAGGTTTLSDAVTGGTWVSSNTTVATIGLTTGVVTGVGVGTSNITYTSPAGCISTTTVTVIVLTTITGNEPFCQGSAITLADGSGGGVWSSGNPGVATVGPSSGVVTGVSGGTANITYTGGGGCYTTAVVTVNPTPSPITGPSDVCQYLTITLADASPAGVWGSSTPAVATINSSGLVTGISPGATTITYTLPTTCFTTKVVTVHAKPVKPVVAPPTYCQFEPAVALTATPATGLLWYGPGVTAGSAFAPVPLTTTAGVTNYYVTETSSFGCVSDSAIDPVTVKPQPAPPTTRDSSYCQFSQAVALNYQVDSAYGSNLNWYAASSGGATLGAAPVPPSNVVTYPAGTTWFVSQTVNGCESNRSPVTVTIVYLPNFTIRASNTWVCDHDSLSFAYNSTTPLVSGTYQWQLPPGATCVGGTTVTDPSIIVRFDSVYGPHILYLTVGELNNMCTSTDTISVTVIPPPETHCYMKPDICLGDTVSLSISDKSSDASVFSWFIDGTPLGSAPQVNIIAANSNSGGPFSLSWNDTGIHYITIMCTTNQGCRSTPTYDTVEVHPLPDATFTFAPKATGTLCLEDSVLFKANNSNVNCAYMWEPEHFFNNDNKPEIWGKVDEAKSIIMLIVTDPFGCKANTTQEIDPNSCCSVLFPSAFTPNGDGKNDHFRPLLTGYHRFHSFRVVNRWGQTVFESANSNPEWDGNYNGVPQDMGTYYYYIQYDCGGNTISQKGDCTLVR